LTVICGNKSLVKSNENGLILRKTNIHFTKNAVSRFIMTRILFSFF